LRDIAHRPRIRYSRNAFADRANFPRGINLPKPKARAYLVVPQASRILLRAAHNTPPLAQGSPAMAKKISKELVTIDRRRNDRRDVRAEKATTKKTLAKVSKKNVEADVEETEEATAAAPVESIPQMERRAKVNRRRQIDPTTCEREYSDDEVEFMQALDAYKRKNGRMFPTCSEVLEVVRSLGYTKVAAGMTVVPLAQAVAGEVAGNTADITPFYATAPLGASLVG
jgi:hypothetical protein